MTKSNLDKEFRAYLKQQKKANKMNDVASDTAGMDIERVIAKRKDVLNKSTWKEFALAENVGDTFNGMSKFYKVLARILSGEIISAKRFAKDVEFITIHDLGKVTLEPCAIDHANVIVGKRLGISATYELNYKNTAHFIKYFKLRPSDYLLSKIRTKH